MQLLAGRYGLGDVIGHGGSAVVHHGFDTILKRPVAIKIFDGAATGVLREARTAAGLSHPNIAQVYDYGEVVEPGKRTPYLVMEFLDGETLADRLARTGALRWRQAAAICADAAAALAAAHAQNLVHRDVNPRNVMLTAESVKVLDFGISTAAGQNGIDTGGGLWGSPSHLAPEQLRGEPTFTGADVYSLGLLLFECLTGSRAWPGGTLGEVLATRHGRPAPRLPRTAGPREVVRLYEACTSEDAAARPSAIAVAETLRALVDPAPRSRPMRQGPLVRQGRPARSDEHAVVRAVPAGTPPPARSPHRSRRRTAVTAAAAVVAGALSIFGVQLANGTATPGGRQAEAAVDGAHPAPASPRPSSPAPAPARSSSPATARVHRSTTATTVDVRKTAAPAGPAPVATPTTTPDSRPPTTPPASPSHSPVSSPPPDRPTPSHTPESGSSPTDAPTEPTDPVTSAPPEDTPPVTAPPEPPAGDGTPA